MTPSLSQAPEQLLPAGSPHRMRAGYDFGANAVCGGPIMRVREQMHAGSRAEAPLSASSEGGLTARLLA